MRKVLKASAGTGKTYSLSLEYILALLDGQSFEEIVVMTFTRKATAEIRERIFEHLAELLDEGVDSQVYQSLEGKRPGIVVDLHRVEEVYHQMLINKEKIHIYTIDSFINQIFKKSIAPYLGVFNYQIVEEEKNKEIIEEVFKEILDNPIDFALLEKFLSENVERDLSNYLHLIGDILNNRWKFLLLDYKKREKRDCSQLSSKLDQSIDILESIIIEKGKEFSAKFLVKDFKSLISNYRLLDSLEAKENMIMKNYSLFFSKSFWNKNKLRGKAVASLRESLDLKYEEFLIQLANYIYNEELIPYEEEIFKFSTRIFEIADKLKFKLKAFTHSDISNYTYMYMNQEELKLMDNNSFTDYFYELIDIEIKSIFIDEFQDTSILQWKILKGLLDRSANVITVGDEKQSIYGWRGGEKDLFTNLDKIIAAETEPLLTCYRSQKEIIEFVNKFFYNLDLEWEYNHVDYLPSKENGYFELLLGGEKNKTNTETKSFAKLNKEKQELIMELNEKITGDMKKAIAERIKELSSGSDIGVLARSNNHLSEIAMELDKLSIPYLLESKDSLLDHEAIRPLYFLLNYINYNDYFNLLKFMRSDLLGVSNKFLRYLLENKEEVKAYILGDIESVSIDNLESVLLEVKSLKKMNYQKLSNYLIENSGIIDKYSGNSAALKNIYHFFKLMRRFTCLSDFMRYLEENKESDELKQLAVKEENAVKLMSIHKSKGLSFETEFFYWDPSSAKGANSNGMEFYLNFDENFQELEDYLLTNSKYEKIFEYLDIDFAEKRKAKELIEEINNIYVALTRAENNLFLYIEGPRKLEEDNEGRCWSGSSYDFYEDALLKASDSYTLCDLIERKEFGELMIGRIEKREEKIEIPLLKPYFSSSVLSAERLDEINKKKDFHMTMEKELKRIEGLALHYYLENIKYNTKTERDYAFNLMMARYGNILGLIKIEGIARRVESFLKKNQIYFEDYWQVFNEYQIEFEGEKYRIDRLLLNEDKKEIFILDYKSGYLKEQSQLDKYKNIVKNMCNRKYRVFTKFLEV
ncbi:UvrD-helicase domain-containing protein [Natronospora cellulosivora (SeqCode)]